MLTHGHYDHVGFAERARRELGVPVYGAARRGPLPPPLRFPVRAAPAALCAGNPGFLKIAARFAANGALWTKAVETVTEFGDGEELPVPGRPKVLATPGHTPGHVALHLPDRDAVITGDALVTLDPYTTLTGPRLVAKAALYDSAQNLRDAGPHRRHRRDPPHAGARRAVERPRRGGGGDRAAQRHALSYFFSSITATP